MIRIPAVPAGGSSGGITSAFGIAAGTGLAGGGALTASVTISISATGVTAATYGDATHVAQFAVNAQGQLSSATAVAITFPSPTLIVQDEGIAAGTVSVVNFIGAGVTVAAVGGTASVSIAASAGGGTAIVGLASSNQFVIGGSPVTGTGTFTISMQTSTVTAGTYGTAGQVPQFTVNAQGQVTNATTVAVSAGSDPWTFTVASGAFSTTSVVAQNITGIFFTPAANTKYEFEAFLMCRTSDITVAPKVGVNWPTGLTDGVVEIQQATSAVGIISANGNIGTAVTTAPAAGLPNNSQSWPAYVWGMIVAGATPTGSIQLTLGSRIATTRTVNIQGGSYLKFRSFS